MRVRNALYPAVLAALAISGAPALAKNGGGKPNPAPVNLSCDTTYGSVISGAVACFGFVTGNAFGGSSDKINLQNLGLGGLGSTVTLTGGSNSAGSLGWNDVFKTTSLGGAGSDTIQFGQTLYGKQIVGAHFGNMAGPAKNVSVFWLFDFGKTGASGVTLKNTQGFSNAQVYNGAFPGGNAGAVPEPATWAMLILGFGVVGGVMRRAAKRVSGLSLA
ncbi:PEPxxWA-CTERM sorting domain-containing protein [Qipengyuania sp.]|uniref:PEPxxWA-CTERM sorting domain-containing protein n=1 Tax=Qipengyuania sp. TaxID=2004515 RepID=UPI0035C7D271